MDTSLGDDIGKFGTSFVIVNKVAVVRNQAFSMHLLHSKLDNVDVTLKRII